MKGLYKLQNGYGKMGNELYKRIECGCKYENLICDISADSLQQEITLQFLRNHVVYMRLVISRELLRSIEFKYVIMILENNFKTEVKSVLNTFTLSSLQAKYIFDKYSKIDGLTLQQTVDVCLLHIDMLYVDSTRRDNLIKSIKRIESDYI